MDVAPDFLGPSDPGANISNTSEKLWWFCPAEPALEALSRADTDVELINTGAEWKRTSLNFLLALCGSFLTQRTVDPGVKG